ncbi:hypothetical protein ACFL1B_04790 [Nanoarchaeota archaeon]
MDGDGDNNQSESQAPLEERANGHDFSVKSTPGEDYSWVSTKYVWVLPGTFVSLLVLLGGITHFQDESSEPELAEVPDSSYVVQVTPDSIVPFYHDALTKELIVQDLSIPKDGIADLVQERTKTRFGEIANWSITFVAPEFIHNYVYLDPDTLQGDMRTHMSEYMNLMNIIAFDYLTFQHEKANRTEPATDSVSEF